MSGSKKYDSADGARLLLALAFRKGIVLNVTKVQKMLYIVYSYFLSKQGRQIFGETPKAWPYGPVFPRTRSKVDYGVVHQTNSDDLSDIAADRELVDKMEAVIDTYAHFTATQLSDWSHTTGSPWYKTTQLKGFKWGDEIPADFINDYFCSLEIL